MGGGRGEEEKRGGAGDMMVEHIFSIWEGGREGGRGGISAGG